MPVDSVDMTGGLPPSLMAEWEELAEEVEAPPFFRPGWIEAWHRSFGRGSLELAQARRGGRLVALVALERRSRGVLASPTNPQTPLFGAVAADPDAVTELMAGIFRSRFTRMAVEHLSDGPAGLRAVSDAASVAGCGCAARFAARAPYIDTSGSLEKYRASVSSKLLREVRRRRRRLEAEGDVELEVSDGSTQLDELLAEGLRLEAAAWKGSAGTAIQSDPPTVAFYRSVARWAADSGMLRLAFLRAGGTPLAFDLALEDRGVHYLLKTGFDPSAREFGPGAMMRWEMISRAFSRGLESYELLGQDEPWKLRWTTTTRRRMHAEVFSPSFAGRASRAWRTGARPLAKRVLRR